MKLKVTNREKDLSTLDIRLLDIWEDDVGKKLASVTLEGPTDKQ